MRWKWAFNVSRARDLCGQRQWGFGAGLGDGPVKFYASGFGWIFQLCRELAVTPKDKTDE